MHDRRIDGETQIFGNAGALFMTAMTWYDHKTESIWSQPWGRAIVGDLKGVQLKLLPSQITTWSSWKAERPETLVMINDVENLRFRQGFSEDFVIGLIIDGQSNAYYYRDASAAVVINDWIGDVPIVLWAADNNFHAYIRKVGDQILTFRIENGRFVDQESGTIWDITLGLALEGTFVGEALLPVPGSSSYDWAWRDFYPQAIFYEP